MNNGGFDHPYEVLSKRALSSFPFTKPFAKGRAGGTRLDVVFPQVNVSEDPGEWMDLRLDDGGGLATILELHVDLLGGDRGLLGGADHLPNAFVAHCWVEAAPPSVALDTLVDGKTVPMEGEAVLAGGEAVLAEGEAVPMDAEGAAVGEAADGGGDNSNNRPSPVLRVAEATGTTAEAAIEPPVIVLSDDDVDSPAAAPAPSPVFIDEEE